eukprot:Em0682g1a
MCVLWGYVHIVQLVSVEGHIPASAWVWLASTGQLTTSVQLVHPTGLRLHVPLVTLVCHFHPSLGIKAVVSSSSSKLPIYVAAPLHLYGE